MKLYQKNIDLRKRILGGVDKESDTAVEIFIEEIKSEIFKIKNFVSKIDDFSSEELYFSLKEFCNIGFNKKDYLRILSMMNKEHYTDYINIKTYMVLANGETIEYFGLTTKKNARFNNERLTLNEIRKLIKSNEFIVLDKIYNKEALEKCEKFENHTSLRLNINNKYIDEKSEIFKYAIEYFGKEMLKKDILYQVKIYYNELIYQIRSITGLAVGRDTKFKNIGIKYKNAYDKATNENYIPKMKRIVISHKKNSLK